MLNIQYFAMPSQSKSTMIFRGNWEGKYDSVVSIGYSFALRTLHTPLDTGTLLADINTYLTLPVAVAAPGGVVGGTNTGGESGNDGGTGVAIGTPVPTDTTTDFIDDGKVTLKINVNADTTS